MKRYSILGLVLSSILLSFCYGAEYREGYLLVKFTDTGTTAASNAARQAVVNAAGGGTIQRMYTLVPGLGLVKLPAGVDVLTAKAAFSASAGVQYAEPDYIQKVQAVPNDPDFARLWGMHNTGQTGGTKDADIDAPEAWDLAKGSSSIVVAVIDSGVDYTHPDLADNMWINLAEQNGQVGVDDDNNGYIDDVYGYDFANMDGDPMDDHGHGTHCAGTIGARGNNNVGVAGVNWQVKIMALKFLTAGGGGSTADAISAVQYAVRMGAKLTNNSWGGYGFSQALYDAIEAAGKSGQLFVAAAGNESNNNDGDTPAYPGSYDLDNIVSVLATDDTDTMASFSNWGKTTVDLAAPGVAIYSTAPGGRYQNMSGTSMACPHVAGAAALIWSIKPDLTYSEVKQVLMLSVDIKNTLEGMCVTGGRLNLYNAVLLVQGGDNLPPLPDPAQWLIKPTATGLSTIVMQAVTAKDKSGVEYRFDCIEDDAYDSGWQSSSLYMRSDYPQGATYSFRVQARDKSANRNQTQWSETLQTTTATGVDDLPPAPNPTIWLAYPRVTRPSLNEIGMEVVASYDENGVEYYFDCVFASDGNQDNYDSGWQTSPVYTVRVSQVAGHEYTFAAYVRQKDTTDPVYITEAAAPMTAGRAASSIVREVPSAAYRTIQDAINAANNGDTVLVHEGVYREININFKGKAITVCSENPDNPAIVAATVIDCADPQNLWALERRRAFLFQNMEGRNSVLAGFTIKNAIAIDNPETRFGGSRSGVSDRDLPSPNDGRDAMGGAIVMGSPLAPASPTIRNCVFTDCFAYGQYGEHGVNGPNGGVNQDGQNGDRGGNGGNAYGGAIYAYSGSAPLIKGCQFINCQAVGGEGGNGGNGGDGGGHSDNVEEADGHHGGHGGDAGLGGCAWGGAMYFESDCSPELYDVTVRDCFVRVGEAGRGGNGGNGSDAKGQGDGGNGGNGGIGGDLRAPDSCGGAVYYGKNTKATIVGCRFENCRVIAELSGDYSGGNGGNGGNGEGDGSVGGNGGHGGPAYFIPDKMRLIGNVNATGGTGGNGGPRGRGGNGGYRNGTGGAPGGISYNRSNPNTGIFPSNIYYMAYYWEDTTNVFNYPDSPEDYTDFGFQWEWEPVLVNTETLDYYDPANPDVSLGTYDRFEYQTVLMINSPFSPYYGLVASTMFVEPTLTVETDPNTNEPVLVADYDNPVITPGQTELIKSLTPTNSEQPNAGACAGANYYGQNSIITMRDTTVSFNSSFANHGGGELYDKGCRATFENCIFEGNTTLYETAAEVDYKFEGYGGGIFADQPVSMIFNGCQFSANSGFAGGALYCNFGPSDANYLPELQITDTTFTANRADYHFIYSYGGAVYAGNSLTPYEEYYFNYLKDYRYTNAPDYALFFRSDLTATEDFTSFIASVYAHSHGEVEFTHPITTQLWDDRVEADYILKPWGEPDKKYPVYPVSVEGSIFDRNLSPYGAGLYLDACDADVSGCHFEANTACVGAGGFVFASDITAGNNTFFYNTGREIESLGYQSQADNSTVEITGKAPALYLSNSDSFLISNRFVANESGGLAGALFINGLSPTGYPQSVFNCLFVENSSGYAGGALIADGGTDVEVLNCTFAENLVSDRYGYGGGIVAHDAYMSITNTILWGNLAALGPQLCIGDPVEVLQEYDPFYVPATTVFVDFSDLQGGQNDVYIDWNGWPWLEYGDNNIEDNPATLEDESDPQFIEVTDPNDATGRTFYLAEIAAGQLTDSPCLDSGTPTHFIYDPAVGGFVTVPDTASWLQEKLGYEMTTRTDHAADTGIINMGYHYDASLPVLQYSLTTSVFISDREPHGTIQQGSSEKHVEPLTLTYPQGTVVLLQAFAEPEDLYRVARWIGSDDDRSFDSTNTITLTGNRTVQVAFELAVPKYLYVPESYDTIEDAVTAARSGDTIVLTPRPSQPYYISNPDGIDFGRDKYGRPKEIVITSVDPNDPLVVAQTIIDCRGSRYSSKRAFRFSSGQTAQTRIEGITIRNAFTARIGLSAAVPLGRWPWWTGDASWYGGPIIQEWVEDPPNPSPLPPMRALSGMDATGDSYGGAILCENGSSPVIRNCVFENCTVAGGIGGDGANGNYPANMQTDQDLDSQSGGHSGKGTGDGYGGAIAVRSQSSPQIVNCTFRNNRATGGWGGIPGNAGLSYNNGRYGWGGNDPAGLEYAAQYFGYNPQAGYGEGDGHGGAIYVEAGCKPQIKECIFENNYARPGYVSAGGREAAGNDYPQPFDSQTVGAQGLPWGNAGARAGRNGILLTYDTIAGGAIYLEDEADILLENCIFKQNQAYEVYTYNDAPVATRGGAVHSDPNVVLTVVDSMFRENLAGALYCSTGSTLTVDKAQFINNLTYLDAASPTATFDIAGGITVAQDANAVSMITNCQFLGNTSHTGGAAVRADGDMYFENCIMNGNQSLVDGGAVYSFVLLPSPDTHTTKLTFVSCELSGNTAQGYGGAVFAKNCILEVTDSFIVHNTAYSGGAVRISEGELTMGGCLIYANEATGLNAGSYRTVTAEGYGGGVHITDTPFSIVDTRFQNNKANGIISAGGGLCITGSQTYYKQNLLNCLFADNQSDNIGGGIACQLYVDLQLDNCTFANNVSGGQTADWSPRIPYVAGQFVMASDGYKYKSKIGTVANPNLGHDPVEDTAKVYWERAEGGGALHIDHLSRAVLKNSIISGNKGIAVYEKLGGNSKVSYTLFYANAGGDMHNGADGVVYSGVAAPEYANNKIGDPLFAAGPLGMYYLDQTASPAVNAGSITAAAAGLDVFTTSPSGSLDTGMVDLGYHYQDAAGLASYSLSTSFRDEAGTAVNNAGTITTVINGGTVIPASGMFKRGAILELTANVDSAYYLTGWSGGTINDNTTAPKNTVLMARNKDIAVLVRLRRTLYVGTSAQYDTLGDAIYAAQDGDTILVAPGEYTSPSQLPSIANSIFLTGKKITIAGFNPDDENVVRATVFRDYRFELADLDNQTVIDGITMNQCWMYMENSDPIIRNCVFSECQFANSTEVHSGTVPAGTDGYHQPPIYGGAIAMFNSSPKIINCTFENNSVRGANGENGFAGGPTHPTGGDGGWPGAAYGGAVYCVFSSKPEFIRCTFTGNEVFGGNGGNGANGWVNAGNTYDGGRGGGWLYDPEMEEYLRLNAFDTWDGWANNSYGDKYSAWSIYANYYGVYDIDVWARWFGWGDNYTSWEDFMADYNANPYDPLGDPYDQLLDVWRYSGFGGAVYCEFDSDARFEECIFENNQSHGGLTGVGGVIADQTSRPDRQLNIPTAGGAVYAAHDSDLTFDRCVFRNNLADKSMVQLPHTYQVSFGGAVAYEFNCTVTFDDCDFQDNDATVGGGMYGRDSFATIADCNILSNQAYIGAGIYLQMEEADITNTVFRANRAWNSDVSGTIDLAGCGAGLFANVLNLNIRDSVFVQNAADISGGGLMVTGVSDEPTDIFNCLFVHNTAGRDGAGASVNWHSNARFGSCTFADNSVLGLADFTASGGGLYIGYNSTAQVIDSIFWGNTATQGESISVATGFASEPRPSTLAVSYTDVMNYPSANAIYVASGCTLDTGAGIFSGLPMFEAPLEADDIAQQYYLNQTASQCKDKGSQTSVQAGLDSYTTSITGARDKGLLDLGYHYLVSPRVQCSIIDEALWLSGRIDLGDLLAFADRWLNAGLVCAESNNWCGGADLNYDGDVNLDDMSNISVCWLVEDTEPPFPNPAQWAMEPNAIPDTYGTIEMLAAVHHDAWWPDSYLEYYFDCIQPPDGPDRGWSTNPYFKVSGLKPGGYKYVLRVRDGSGNMTADSVEADVIPGQKTTLPQAQWLNPPFVMNAQFAIQMEALAYENFGTIGIPVPSLPSGYVIKYQYEYRGTAPGGDSRAYMADRIYIDTGMVAGQTYTYRVRMGLFYEPGDGTSTKIADGPWSEEASVVAIAPDLEPPQPNPAQHASGSPFQIYVASQGVYYHVVTAVAATDPSDVEYKFVCSDSSASSGSSNDPDGIEWRNADNVAGLFYPNGTAQVPNQYWSRIGLVNQTDKVWYVITRDRSPNRNTGQTSVGRTIASPEP